MTDIAIRVQNLSKCYHIYDNPRDRLKQFVAPRLQRMAWQQPKQYFREFWALKDVSFEIKKGETVGIIGRNGSGKSTLLKMICGTLTPTSGSIQTDGRIAALLELGSGFNPQFTGRENIYMNAAVLGLSKKEIDERFDDIVAFADIGDFIEQPIKTYSSGMTVRLAFSVIAHVDADILVIDEALAVGDMFFQQKCMRYLHEHQDSGGSLLFVTHNTNAIINMCDRAIMLERDKAPISGVTDKICQIYIKQLYSEKAVPEVLVNRSKIVDSNLMQLKNDSSGKQHIGEEQSANIIRITPFRNFADSFGCGGVNIIDAWFEGTDGQKVSMVQGGDLIKFCIKAKSSQSIQNIAFGFMIKDRLGQYIIAEGSDQAYRNCPPMIKAGDIILVEFEFLMPILIQGEYSLNVAVADGIGDDHVQHHWINDALALVSLKSRLVHGISGLQDINIVINVSN